MKIIVKKLVWDAWNIAHIARHDVVPDEVEEVCKGSYLTYESYDGRYEIIGATRKGVYYVVTAHTANKKDRTLYQKKKEGEAA